MARYKTDEWLPPRILASSGIVEGDSEVTPLIKSAVNRELQARGFGEVPSGRDLQVKTFALAESGPQVEAAVFPGNLAIDFATPMATIGRYNREGTLVVNLTDPRTRKAAWAGMAGENLKNKPTPGESEDRTRGRLFLREVPGEAAEAVDGTMRRTSGPMPWLLKRPEPVGFSKSNRGQPASWRRRGKCLHDSRSCGESGSELLLEQKKA